MSAEIWLLLLVLSLAACVTLGTVWLATLPTRWHPAWMILGAAGMVALGILALLMIVDVFVG